MATTPNLNLPLLDSTENVSEDHQKINVFLEALDARLGEVAVTLAGLAVTGHSHEMSKINGLAEALALLAPGGHGHKLDDLSDVAVTDAPEGAILQKKPEGWGVGQRGYSVEEINNIVTQLADDDHNHTVDDVEGLSITLANLSDVTKNTRFAKTLSIAGDLYLNNKAVISNDSNGEFGDRSSENIDHIWHDDGDNAWHFVSDGPYRSAGNTKLVAGHIDALNTTASMKDQDHWLGRYRLASENTENISTNRTANCLFLENKQYAPANASDDLGYRFYKRGIFSITYIDGNSPGKTYEAFGGMIAARQRSSSPVRVMAGLYIQTGTDTDTTGEVDYMYGLRSYSVVNGKGKVGTYYGAHITINPNRSDCHIAYPRGLYIHMDYDAGTIDNEPIALYQNYDGSWDGHRRIGIFQNDVQYNYFTGTSYIDSHEVVHAGNIEAIADAAGISRGLGTGNQYWRNMSGSRSTFTVYQNTSGKSIEVAIYSNSTEFVQVSFDGSTWISLLRIGTGHSASFVVPEGHYYKFNGAFNTWRELR
ncbi:hypothetical protein [Pseudovibrio ascidiaceicola]|uniref:hypothetical protein n=1 Tax=Pseudovibrio ascidiaceicola TaxID=285279 RepID=UPI000D691850|nr:hypothetical protein [Pseudovibrio ascidiaceicola]